MRATDTGAGAGMTTTTKTMTSTPAARATANASTRFRSWSTPTSPSPTGPGRTVPAWRRPRCPWTAMRCARPPRRATSSLIPRSMRATWATGATRWTAGITGRRSSCGPVTRPSRTAPRPLRPGPLTSSPRWRQQAACRARRPPRRRSHPSGTGPCAPGHRRKGAGSPGSSARRCWRRMPWRTREPRRCCCARSALRT